MQSNFTDNPLRDRDNSPLVVSFGNDPGACSQDCSTTRTGCTKRCGESPAMGIRCGAREGNLWRPRSGPNVARSIEA
ncbi:unnamed protein product [Urochloa humidicola]